MRKVYDNLKNNINRSKWFSYSYFKNHKVFFLCSFSERNLILNGGEVEEKLFPFQSSSLVLHLNFRSETLQRQLQCKIIPYIIQWVSTQRRRISGVFNRVSINLKSFIIESAFCLHFSSLNWIGERFLISAHNCALLMRCIVKIY